MNKRKNIRLPEYNYAQNGGYFVTMCVKDMKCILGKIKPNNVGTNNVVANCVRQEKGICPNIVDANSIRSEKSICANNVVANCVRPKIELSYIGKIVENEINKFNNIYEYVRIYKYVIMPNHINMIIIIERPDGRTQFAPT